MHTLFVCQTQINMRKTRLFQLTDALRVSGIFFSFNRSGMLQHVLSLPPDQPLPYWQEAGNR